MMPRLIQLLAFLLISLLASCGIFGSRYDVDSIDGKVETLGQKTDRWKKEQRNAKPNALAIQSIVSDSVNSVEGRLTGSQIADVYRKAYELIKDPITKNHILQRLAAIDLKTAENLDISGVTESQEAYQVAIDAYTELLKTENQLLSADANQDELLYALSKAYALKGDRDAAFAQLNNLVNSFPQSKFWLEAQFRRGEYLFVENRFDDSTRAFQEILARENNNSDSKAIDHKGIDNIAAENNSAVRENAEFFSNARYMAGWSEFKNSQYENAVQYFVRLLDDYAMEIGQVGLVSEEVFAQSYKLGAKAFEQDNKVIQDALRAISLSMAYAPVDESLLSLEQQLSDKFYAHWVYAEIGELFFKQERLSDSARIYGEYERVKPESMLAPWFLNQKIATLQHSGFKDEAWEEKAGFANRYHPSAKYYLERLNEQNATRVYVDDRIGVYLDELASFYHAKGRALASKPELSADSTKALDQASYWYRQKISAFPQDSEIANTYYLLAESLQEADHLPDAIQAYEYAAYSGSNYIDAAEGLAFEKANEAGYAAILVYTTHIDRLEKSANASSERGDVEPALTELSVWRGKKIESALLFSDEFPEDLRRDLVLANTVKDLQLQEEWLQVIEVADKLLVVDAVVEDVDIADLKRTRAIEPKLALPAWLASAGAAFTLESFSDAEHRYANAINMMQTADTQNAEQKHYLVDMRNRELQTTIDNYASSIYSQAEQANAVGEKSKAIEQFQRLVDVAPSSQLRVAAQRDSIVLMAETKQWQLVKQAVPQFIDDFPNHQDKLDMQRRLLNANVQLQDWTAASTLASAIANDLELNRGSTDTDASRRQEAVDLRFASADYAISSGDKQLAITRYEDLIRHNSVVDESLYETHFRLASLYAETKNRGKELSQYRVIKQLEAETAKRTDRSLYIVAHAETELAELDYISYQQLKIQQPLLESLKRKQAALEVSVAAYTRVENYAVEKYALLSTQRKAQIYADFAKAIMDSDRPAGLDDLALEEYEILLEDQAYPFEEQAVEIYEVNVKRAWHGSKSPAITESYKALAELLPARYGKSEILD